MPQNSAIGTMFAPTNTKKNVLITGFKKCEKYKRVTFSSYFVQHNNSNAALFVIKNREKTFLTVTHNHFIFLF